MFLEIAAKIVLTRKLLVTSAQHLYPPVPLQFTTALSFTLWEWKIKNPININFHKPDLCKILLPVE